MAITCKFGGTSLACSRHIQQSCRIVKADERRKYVVVSAPGKVGGESKKVTDLLLACYANRFDAEVFESLFLQIKERFLEIATLANGFPMEEELKVLYAQIKSSEANVDFVLSRGEYLNAKLIAAYLGYEFLDATSFIRFQKGELDLVATLALGKRLNKEKRYVIPGFYGLDEHGHVKTFSRGGSDITGSIVARVFDCELYENWTDVDGIYVADPKTVKNSRRVGQVSFRELREMSYMGASVLHAETLMPLYESPIPILLKNSFQPEAEGTQILKKRTEVSDREVITCITGKNDYTCIQISKAMLDKELGFVKKATAVFEKYHINISHTHSGLDNLCFFVENSEYKQIAFEAFVRELETSIDADKIKGHQNIALVAVVGHNLSGKIGMLAKIFNALEARAINVKTIYQSISECNIILGIEEGQLNDCIKALYQGLIEEKE